MLLIVALIFLLTMGMNLSFLILKQPRKVLLHLATTALFSYLIPVFLIWSLDLLKIEIVKSTVLYPTLVLTVLLTLLNFRNYKEFFGEIKKTYFSQSKYQKAATIIMVLGFLQVAGSYTILSLREGDGKANWAWKSEQWILKKSISYHKEEARFNRLERVIATYPTYHSVSLMFNIFAVKIHPAQIVKLSDFIYFFGMLSVSLLLAKILGLSNWWLIFAIYFIPFVQRSNLHILGSAYSYVNLNYMCLLQIALFLIIQDHIQNAQSIYRKISIDRYYIVLGILFGVMATTKSEGFYRFLISFGVFGLYFLFKLKISLKKLMKCFVYVIPILAIFKYFDRMVLSEYSRYNEYLDNLALSSAEILEALPIVLKAIYLSFVPTLILESYWFFGVLLAALSLIQMYRRKSEHLGFSVALAIIFILNVIFNSLPMLISRPPVTWNSDPHNIAENLISRINGHSGGILFLICLLGIYQYAKDGGFLYLKQIYSQLRNRASA